MKRRIQGRLHLENLYLVKQPIKPDVTSEP